VKEIAKGLLVNESIIILNLADNSIYNRGAEVLLEILKNNKTIEKIILANNYLGEKIVEEINNKTYRNAFNLRKRRIPNYLNELNSITISATIINKLKEESIEVQELKAETEVELKANREEWQKIKQVELGSYKSIKQMHDGTMKEEKSITNELERLNEYEETMKIEYGNEIDILTKKLKAITYESNKIKELIESKKVEVIEKRQQNETIIQQLNEEYEEIFRSRARNAKKKEKEEMKLIEEYKSLGGKNELALIKKMTVPFVSKDKKNRQEVSNKGNLIKKTANKTEETKSTIRISKPKKKPAKKPKRTNLRKTLK